jgi:hypothetical protein
VVRDTTEAVQGLGDGARAAYYRAALGSLRFVQERRPTRGRFGADADAMWASFRGDLTTADRIDLLLRDADAEWPGAFGARRVFELPATADDEPFGADWQPLDSVDAEELWRGMIGESAPSSPGAAMQAIASAWGQRLAPCAAGQVGATDRIIVAGASAIASLVEVFASEHDLDWGTQVTVVATPPAHRQLAAAATALLNAGKATQLLSAAHAKQASVQRGARLLVSEDAAPDDRAAAEHLARAS